MLMIYIVMALMDKVDSVQEEMHNVNREMEILRIKKIMYGYTVSFGL